MLEVDVAARAMNDADLSARQQSGIFRREVIHVNGEQMTAESAIAFEVLDGRADSTIAHITSIAPQPIEHVTFCPGEHGELVGGLADVDGHGPMPFGGNIGAETQQFWVRGVGGVRGQSGPASATGQSIGAIERFAKNRFRIAPGFDSGHLEQ